MNYLSALSSAFRKFFGLFLGGYWTWIGITIYVLYDNREAFLQLVTRAELIPVFKSIGVNLAGADQVVLANTEKILQGSVTAYEYTLTWKTLEYTLHLEAVAYLSAFAAVLGGLAYILWYFKAFDKFLQLVFGPGSSHLAGTAVLAPVVYALMVYAVRGDVPFDGVLLFVENFEAVWDSVNSMDLVNSALDLGADVSEPVNSTGS